MLTACILFLSLLNLASSSNRAATTYINSNDRVSLQLLSRPLLRGPPGSFVNMQLLLLNEGGASNFIISQESEDRFLGDVLDPASSFLTTNMRQEVTVQRMMVPDRPEGSVVRTTFFAVRQKNWRKKKSVGGFHEFNPHHGDGSFGNEEVASLSIEFQVTSERGPREFYPPVGSLHYRAQSSDEACQSTVGTSECRAERWGLSVEMIDEDAGLGRPEILTTSTDFGEEGSHETLSYRMTNFPIGTREKQRVDIDVSCCMKSISVKIHNTVGEAVEMKAEAKGYGNVDSDDLWSDGYFIAFLVVGIFMLLLLIGLIAICIHVRRSRYSSVSQR